MRFIEFHRMNKSDATKIPPADRVETPSSKNEDDDDGHDTSRRYILKRKRGPKENNIVINPVDERIFDLTQEEHPLDMSGKRYIFERKCGPVVETIPTMDISFRRQYFTAFTAFTALVKSTRNVGAFQVF